MAARHRIVAALVIAAVGLAFADASVVALALPDLYGEFDTSIVGVSWVLTTYALAVAVTAVPVALAAPPGPPAGARRRRRRGVRRRLARRRRGAGLSPSCWSPAPRKASAPRCCSPARSPCSPRSSPARGGPAGGGRWPAPSARPSARRSAACSPSCSTGGRSSSSRRRSSPPRSLVALDPAARALRREGHVHGEPGTRRRDVVTANVGFALVFAALVAALFLGVLLAIEVWRYSPIAVAPLLVSALPLGMVLGRLVQPAPAPSSPSAARCSSRSGCSAWRSCRAPRRSSAAVAFAVCGAGFDLVHEVLDGAAVPADGPAVRAAAVSIGARHAGLVLGLALIAPVLSSSLEAGIERATLGATRTMLTTELPLSRQAARHVGAAHGDRGGAARSGARPRRPSSTSAAPRATTRWPGPATS